jgi:serine/threonine protein kinase
VIKLVGLRESENRIFMVTEWMKGGNLGKICEGMAKQGKRMSEEDARLIITQLMKGVAHIHSKGIIHRDIKPDNVLFLEEGSFENLKLADFGLSTEFSQQWSLNCVSSKVGTALYMAPEVFEEKSYSKVSRAYWVIYYLGKGSGCLEHRGHSLQAAVGVHAPPPPKKKQHGKIHIQSQKWQDRFRNFRKQVE